MKKCKNRILAGSLAGIIMAAAISGCGASASNSSSEAVKASNTENIGAEPSTTRAPMENQEPAENEAPAGAEETVEETALPEATMAAAMAPGQGAYKTAPSSMRDDGFSIYVDAYAPAETNTEEYNHVTENGFKRTEESPLSTFSIDVDTASYANIRRMINQGRKVPADAVRIEEMINYFSYDYPEPEKGQPFSVTAELSDCPWDSEHQLMLIGLQAEEIDFDNRPMSNLVFLLDVSGSMYDENKLPLVQKSFSMLTDELTENDRVSIVTYAGYEQVVLEGARGDQKEKIREALDGLMAGGSTAGEAGINRAYQLAEKYFIEGGNNRVILATDGDLNVGASSESELTRLIEEKRKSGVHLSVLGFGMGNIKDNKMEALADNGDGNYAYIDTLLEARKVLVEEMGGTLFTVAKDVKLQIEFNPDFVKEYRLLGYENRALADEDFDDDTVDAGEIGAGHRVTALYEIVKTGASAKTDPLLTVNIRYKAPDGDVSKLLSVPVKADIFREEMTDNMRLAAAAAEFGMILKDSRYKGDADYQSVLKLLNQIPEKEMDDYKSEFKILVTKAMDL